jgi:signal transduction histidine kinase
MLTEQRRSLKAEQYEAAEVIVDGATQLQDMINDLLDLARSDAGKLRIRPEPTAVRPLVQRLAKQMRPNFQGKGQKLTCSIEKGVGDVQADAGRIGQVLANLLTNANKYCPEGARVRVTAAKAGRQVEFTVSDDGPGLSQDAVEHVFDRFWRAESGETQEVGGTGLGLAIARSLVDLHGGEIGVTSAPGQGATFRFVLPAAKKRKRSGARRKAPSRRRTRARAAG